MTANYIKHGKVSVLVDGQFGSTGKGLLAAYLASQPGNEADIAVTNSSANAGHWTKFADPIKKDFCCFHLPTFGVMQPYCDIYLNAGAIINPALLMQEIEENFISRKRIHIHPNAAVITEDDIDEEQAQSSQATKIASTRKGVGAALARKIMRRATLAGRDPKLREFIHRYDLNDTLKRGGRVSIEVPQGFSLSINSHFYPHCTSRQCTVSQGLADAQIHPAFLGKVAMSVRTYPIRVGNIMDGGHELGNSGGVYSDQQETSFSELGVEEERTTVTNRVRRIFTWSNQQFYEAFSENRPDIVFLNFMNYIKNEEYHSRIMHSIHKDWHARKDFDILYGYGPNVEDVKKELEYE